MPKAKYTREEILKAAAEVVRKMGTEGLNVRAIARELNCSTQPVYSRFANMAEVCSALREEASRLYHEKIESYFAESKRNRYEAYGMGYVRFAKEERGLFRLLFFPAEGAPYLHDPYLKEIVADMVALYGMDERRALLFHRDMSVFSFGLAMLVTTGAELSEREIEEGLRREFYSLYSFYFPERPPLPKNLGESS